MNVVLRIFNQINLGQKKIGVKYGGQYLQNMLISIDNSYNNKPKVFNNQVPTIGHLYDQIDDYKILSEMVSLNCETLNSKIEDYVNVHSNSNEVAELVSYINSLKQNLTNSIKNIKDKNYRVDNFGGDHSIALGSVSGSINRCVEQFQTDKLGLIWIDAHTDINTPLTSPSGNLHGMPVGYLGGLFNSRKLPKLKFNIKSEHIYYIGVRDMDQFEKYYVKNQKIKMYSSDLTNNNTQQVIDEIFNDMKKKGLNYFHTSFDVDSIDPSLISQTGTPVPDGLFLDTGCKLINQFTSSKNCIGFDFVEYNPLIKKNTIKSINSVYKLLESIYYPRTQ